MAIDLDVGTPLIGVDLQEHVADAQRRALVMGHDDLDLLHAGHCRGMATDIATGYPARFSRCRRRFEPAGWRSPGKSWLRCRLTSVRSWRR
jgi:hypothetical protein